MRKIILSALLLAATVVNAQNYDEISKNLKDGKLDEARTKIDKIMADQKNQAKSESWFYKAKVYSTIAKSKPDSAVLEGALVAMQKYFTMEGATKEEKKRYLHSTLDNHSTAFDIRSTFVSEGVKAYQEEAWRKAYYNFARSLDAFDYLAKSQLTNSKMDTSLILYTGAAAQAGKMYSEAAKYYGIIADLRNPDTTNIGVYEFLISYYTTEKDMANRDKYLEMAKQIFPNRDIWMNYELADLSDNMEERLKQYEALLVKYPDNYNIHIRYVSDFFSHIYSGTSSMEQKAKLTIAIQNLIKANPNALSYYIMTQHISNEIYDIEVAMSAIKGTKPEDVQKKKQMTDQRAAKFEAMLPYALKTYDLYMAQGQLKSEDKVNAGKTLDNLVDYYNFKKMPDKVAFYKEKKKNL